jgi:hypothetical protein
MQRLGFLKCVAAIASPSQGQTLEGLTQRFESTITQRTMLSDETKTRFAEYVKRFQLHKRYTAGSGTNVQLQDAYLSDPRLPSASGAITGEATRVGYRHAVYVEIPAWAARLQVIRERNYSLTDRGKLLRLFSSHESWDSFEPVNNPFLIDRPQAFLFLYCLIDADGDLLQLIYRKVLSKGCDSFERGQIGEIAGEALKELATTRLSHQFSGVAKQRLQKAAKIIESILRQPKGSGYGPRESVATPRVEPLVDCGWLQKPERSTYAYRLTDDGKEALARLADSGSVSSFLTEHLVELVSRVRPPPTQPTLRCLRGAYEDLKSGLGYVSIRELVLGSIAKMLQAGEPPYSVATLEKLLLAAPARYGPLVRLAQGRIGGLAQVRIHQDVFREVDHG